MPRRRTRCVPWIGVTCAAEEVEPRAEALDERIGGEQLGSCGGELECERQAVEPFAQRLDRGRPVDVRPDRARAGEEELYGLFFDQRR